MEKFTLIFGCILFGESQGSESIYISEVYEVKKVNTIEEGEMKGDEYVDSGGDSYLILETCEDPIFSKVAKEQLKKILF